MREKLYRTAIYLGIPMLLGLLFFPGVAFAEAHENISLIAGALGKIEGAISGITGFFTFASIAYSLIGKVLFGISVVITWILGVAIAIVSWSLGVVLSLNGDIVNSPVVQSGFYAVLSLANLGLVLGIIVIAIATILRNQTYGIKQILVKLIVAAVLINFGLVIAGGVIKFADELSLYFIREISPGGQGMSWEEFGTKITGAFQPQGFHGIDSIKFLNAENQEELQKAFAQEDVGRLMQNTIGPLMAGFTLTVVIIILAVLIIMLLYRYVSLSFLLVLLPLAWLSAVFPSTKENYQKWLSKFLHQTFFAPIVVFFIWLTLLTAAKMNDVDDPLARTLKELASDDANRPFANVIALAGDAYHGIFLNIMQAFVLVSILMGGMVAANKFGIEFAGAAQKGMENMKGWATGKLSRAGLKGGRRAYQGLGLQKLGEKMAASGIPGASALGRGMMTLPAIGGKDLVSESMKEFSNMETEQIVTSLKGFMGNEQRFAAIQELQKRGKLGKIETVGGSSLLEFKRQNEQLFKDYGQGKLIGDIDKKIGFNEIALAAAEGNNNEALREAMFAFVEKLTPGEVASADLKKLFSGEAQYGLTREIINKLGEAFSGALALRSDRLIPSAISGLDGPQLEQYRRLHISAMGRELELASAMEDIQDRENARARVDRGSEIFNRAIANNAFMFVPPAVATDTATQPQPQPQPPQPATPKT